MQGDDDDSSDDEGGLEGALAATMPVAAAVNTPPDLSARLKSLYSPANKMVTQNVQQPQQPQVQHHHHMQQHQQQQQQQQQMQQQQQQQHVPSLPPPHQQQVPPPHMSRAPSSGASTNIMPMTHMQPSRIPPQLSPQVSRPLVPNRSRAPDPFEPTPLTTMISRHSSHNPPPNQQQQQDSDSSTMTIRTSNVPMPHMPPRQQVQQQQLQQQQQHHHHMSSSQPPQQHQRHPPSNHHVSVPHHMSTHPQQQQPQQQQQQQPQQHHPSVASNSHVMHSSSSHLMGGSSSSSSAANRAQMEREQKKAKEQFLMFTRVLMKYLENKDPNMHARAKQVIRECAEKNKKKEHGFESVTASMKTRLRATVGESYWKRAEGYLTHFQTKMLERKKATVTMAGGSSATTTKSASSSSQVPIHGQPQSSSLSSQQQQQQAQAQAAQQAAMQKQLAERQLNERRARERMAEQERLKKEAERKKAAAEEAVRKQKQQAAEKMRQHQEAAAKLNQIRESTKLQMQNMKAQTEQQRAASAAATAAAAASAPAATKRQVDPSTAAAAASSTTATKRKGSSSSVTTTAPSASASVAVARSTPVRTMMDVESPPREYSEFMEMIDHAVDYDWNSAGLLLGNKSDVDLSAEQHKLLYGNSTPKISTDHRLRRGWSDRNIVSARTAWAKVRLPELARELKESQSATPVVAGVSLPSDKVDSTKLKTTWFNEDKAETDRTLAVLSEATEIYIKQVLEKALQCARQRENLEGIRLWHMQHSSSKPPIGLRLGCDVSRQVALAAGNAARTVQRMEEALQRNPAEKRDLSDPEVLSEATSMNDLACRPKLATGAESASYQAKRCFEISGGKDATSPPFGRVPKQAKIMAHDFDTGFELGTQKPPRFLAFHFM